MLWDTLVQIHIPVLFLSMKRLRLFNVMSVPIRDGVLFTIGEASAQPDLSLAPTAVLSHHA